MAFVKKNWVPYEDIEATELNRLEVGIDEIYDLAVTLGGNKQFDDHIALSQAEQVGKALYITLAAAAKGELGVDAALTYALLAKEYGGEGFKFEDSLGGIIEVELGTINDIILEAHGGRHNAAGVGGDLLGRAADIIVDKGGNGDYLTLEAALAAASNGDAIYVKPASTAYGSTGIVSALNDIYIFGEGPWSRINFSTTTARMILNGNRVRLSNMNIQAPLSNPAHYAIELNGPDSIIEDCLIVSNQNGLYIGDDYGRANRLDVIESGVGGQNGIVADSDYSMVTNCNIEGFPQNGIVVGAGVRGNIICRNTIDSPTPNNYGLILSGDEAIANGNLILNGTNGVLISVGANDNLLHGNVVKLYSTSSIIDSGTNSSKWDNIT